MTPDQALRPLVPAPRHPPTGGGGAEDAGNGQAPAVLLRGVSKTYPPSRGFRNLLRKGAGVQALCDVDVTLEAGRVLGLLGPNGAGKTTLQKILVNLVTPSAGEVWIAGRRVRGDQPRTRRLIGYVPSDERSFFWRLSGLENLRFFAVLYEIEPRLAEERIRSYLREFGVEGQEDRPFAVYSSGRKKIFNIVRGLLAAPPILVLDEATNSLDPPAARLVMEHVRHLATEEGRAVVWATHRLEEVQEVCDRVMLIDGGHVRFQGDVSAFVRLRAGLGAEAGVGALEETFRKLIASR